MQIHQDLATAGLTTADFRYRRSNFWEKISEKKRDLSYFSKIFTKMTEFNEITKDWQLFHEQLCPCRRYPSKLVLRSSHHFDFMPKLLHNTFAQKYLATAEPCYRRRSDRPFSGGSEVLVYSVSIVFTLMTIFKIQFASFDQLFPIHRLDI